MILDIIKMPELDLKKNTGDENARARDLFYGLWVPDLFMERVKQNSKWSMFCPSICPDLSDLYGDEYKVKYEKYENFVDQGRHMYRISS